MDADGDLEEFMKQPPDTQIKLQNVPPMKNKGPEVTAEKESTIYSNLEKSNQGLTSMNPGAQLNKNLNHSMPVIQPVKAGTAFIPPPVSKRDDTQTKDFAKNSLPNAFPGPQPKPDTKISSSNIAPANKQVNPIARPVAQTSSNTMLQGSTNHPSPAVIKSSLCKFVNLLCKHSSIQAIISNNSLERLAKIQVPEEIRSSSCRKCNAIKINYCLSCSHTECLRCFTSSISQLQTLPYSLILQNISCSICRLNYSSQDIKNILGKNAYEKLLNEPFTKLCYKCNTKRPLISEFSSELSCLHMCRSCYADELMFGAKKCLCCNAGFKNIEKTLQKTEICMKCGACGKLVEDCLRAIHSDHLLCYECLMDSAQQKNCLHCNAALSREEMGILAMFINKPCSICQSNKALTDIHMKSCCGFIVCNDCHSNNPVCRTCSKVR